MFIFVHAIIYFIAKRYETNIFRNEGKLGFLEDSEPALDGNPFGAAFKYLFVKEKEARVGFLGQIARLLVAGVYLGVLSYWLNQSFFNDRFGSAGGFAFYFFVWIGVCMTHWPLLWYVFSVITNFSDSLNQQICPSKKPVEPNT